MKDTKRISASALSIIILLSLFMPWVTITCDGMTVETYSGINTAVGAEIDGEDIDGSIEVIVVAILALVGLASLVLPLVLRVLISGCGLATLIFMFVRLKAEAADVGSGVDVTFEFGYWLALLAFLAIGVLQFLPLPSIGGNRRSDE